MKIMRDFIWKMIRPKVPPGVIMPKWAVIVRAVLYPMEFFYWKMSSNTGYRIENDTWLICGMAYSGAMFRLLAKAQGEVYRITRIDGVVTMERIPNFETFRKDAERYRWLRDKGCDTRSPFVTKWRMTPAACDAAIDNEMTK